MKIMIQTNVTVLAPNRANANANANQFNLYNKEV